jgi:hypothetical protein
VAGGDGLTLPPPGMPFARVDLVCMGVDHSGPSYRVRLDLVGRDAAGAEVGRERTGYPVFGHGGCFGDEGHCEVRGPRHAFDRRPAHQLAPATKVVIATAEVRRLVAAGAVSLTIEATPLVRESPYATGDSVGVIRPFDGVELRVYR